MKNGIYWIKPTERSKPRIAEKKGAWWIVFYGWDRPNVTLNNDEIFEVIEIIPKQGVSK